MTAGACRDCGARHFPWRALCRECWSDAVDPLPITSAGKVEAMTVVHRASEGKAAPYGLAVAAFGEGVRVMAAIPIDGVEPVVGTLVTLDESSTSYATLGFALAPASTR